MTLFLQGATSLGFLVAALFFLRFWRQSDDRLFLLFALAFAAMAVNRFALVFVDETGELGTGLFLIRLLAFVLIVVAIVDKNRAGRPTVDPPAPSPPH